MPPDLSTEAVGVRALEPPETAKPVEQAESLSECLRIIARDVRAMERKGIDFYGPSWAQSSGGRFCTACLAAATVVGRVDPADERYWDEVTFPHLIYPSDIALEGDLTTLMCGINELRHGGIDSLGGRFRLYGLNVGEELVRLRDACEWLDAIRGESMAPVYGALEVLADRVEELEQEQAAS